jgi:uracil-DNA glycosylase
MDVKNIKLVLLGQDPYHGPGQAHGLSFSVPIGIPIPPSLKNIYKELQAEFYEKQYKFQHGNLENWFQREKIFLLNTALTVEKGNPGSHLTHWEPFTNKIIQFISEQNPTAIFLLLGKHAQSKAKLIQNKEKIIMGVHPSPLSAYKGFFGSNIFRKIDELLETSIDWSL